MDVHAALSDALPGMDARMYLPRCNSLFALFFLAEKQLAGARRKAAVASSESATAGRMIRPRNAH